jgi:hypothetical protein
MIESMTRTTQAGDETQTSDREQDMTLRGRWRALASRWTALDRGWKAALLGVVLVAVEFTPVVPL